MYREIRLIGIILILLGIMVVSILGSDRLYPIVLNGKYGYIDKRGRIIIPPRYKRGGKMREGLAPVKYEGGCGFIDEHGNLKIEYRLEESGDRERKNISSEEIEELWDERIYICLLYTSPSPRDRG